MQNKSQPRMYISSSYCVSFNKRITINLLTVTKIIREVFCSIVDIDFTS